MIYKDHKLSYFQDRSQYLLLDRAGRLLDTDGTLFQLDHDEEKSLFSEHPFLESLPAMLADHDPGSGDLVLPCLDLELFGRSGVFDFIFRHQEAAGQQHILWLIYDFTFHYRQVQDMQQSRNDAHIQNELLALKQEILELKNQELERLQAFRMELFAKISHEFRTPVNGILGLTSLLQDAELTVAQKDYLKALSACSDQLLATVNDLLDFSKIELGKVDFEATDFNLKELMGSLLMSFAFTAREKGVSIHTHFDSRLPEFVTGDRLRLSQIIFNLFGNAIKFTRKGSVTLKLEVREISLKEARIRFEVIDTGVGIPEEDLPYIFNPYFQSGQDRSQTQKGTGLGLNIVKQLVERQGGKVEAFSEVNVGSTLAFELPFSIPVVELAQDQPGPSFSSEGEPISARILLIEDSILNQKVTAEILRKQNHTLFLAETGEEGLAILEKEEIDLVITDYHLPGINGIEVLKSIRNEMEEPKRSVQVIALSGSDSMDGKLKSEEYRFNKLLVKPVSPDYLIRTVERVLASGPAQIKAKDKLVHLGYLHEVAGNNTALIAELIDIFIQKIPGSLNEMDRLAQLGEWLILKEAAHQTKANLRYVGIQVLAELADGIEKNAGQGKELDKMPAMLKELRKGCEKAIEELQVYRLSM